MALYVEPITQQSIINSPSLKLDIDKLIPNLSEQLIHDLVDNTQLAKNAYVAMFNGHAIALILISYESNTLEVNIELLVVRESTRRRGVGMFLLTETILMNSDKSNWQWTLAFDVTEQSKQADNQGLNESDLKQLMNTYRLFLDAALISNPNLLSSRIEIKA
ncbi:acetyl-CoA sensor PanZ family protein [Thorsellia anophelis]|uniref:Acetyltransferase (GNAT) domain-containing protein n=1 Tax=Thorsellia anophelis DSM 18579 TaxID=1123402 RepID=A0A1I0AJ49_9GAMM|nr:acetyl-CoA sensor PanZ family protein [Thorsellia anophelis]SES93298.1 Acetyltransferase (GNAT) domain-containing protein [Thorsellia anophelis DSM 18579]